MRLSAEDLDLELLRRLMLRLEVVAGERHWEHRVVVVYRWKDCPETHEVYERIMHRDRGVRVGGYAARAFLRDDMMRGVWENAADGLRNFVLHLAFPHDGIQDEEFRRGGEAVLAALSAPGVVAFGYLGLVYMSKDFDFALRSIHEDLPVASAPDAREGRQVNMLDLAGRTHHLIRPFGEPATVRMCSDAAGDVSTSLRLLVDAVCGTVPPFEEFSVRYPTLATLHPWPGAR